MRRIESSGSVRAISLDRDECLRRLRAAAFPERLEVRLIGSLAAGTHTGTSDVDLVLRVRSLPGNPLEAMKPYYYSRRLEIGLDLFLFGPSLPEGAERMLEGSIGLAARETM